MDFAAARPVQGRGKAVMAMPKHRQDGFWMDLDGACAAFQVRQVTAL
ncbi:MAG: hypothetical protein AAGA88_08035 [Pseudomonadota bacterium]